MSNVGSRDRIDYTLIRQKSVSKSLRISSASSGMPPATNPRTIRAMPCATNTFALSKGAQFHPPSSSNLAVASPELESQRLIKKQLPDSLSHHAIFGTTYAYTNQASKKPADGSTRKGERKSGSWYTSRNIIKAPGSSDRPAVLKMRGPAPRLPARWPSPCLPTTRQTG
jgi:hypothetical protein